MAEQIEMDQSREFVKKLCNLEIPSDIKISPSGERVLYSTNLTWGHVKGNHSVTTLWLATLGEANSAKQITEGTHRDHSLAWHPLKDEFAFISDRAGNGTKSAIYTISLTDLEKVVPITPVENEQAIEKFSFSPDGKMIAFISKDEKTEEEKRREENKEDVQVWGQDYRFSRLRVIDLETGEIRTLSIDQHILDLCWYPEILEESDKLEIGFVTCDNTEIESPYRHGTEIHVVRANLQQPRKVCSLPNRANDLSWGSLNFGESMELYFWSAAQLDKNFCGSALYKVSTEREPCECERVVFDNDENITAVRSIDGHIVVKAQRRLEDCLFWVGVEELYSCGQQIEAYDVAFGFSDGQARLAIATSDINHPVEVYSLEARDDRKVQLSQHGKCFEGQEFGTYKTLVCPTTDRHDIEIDGIYLEPAHKNNGHRDSIPSKPYPTVVLVHGGPTTRVTNAFDTLYYMWTPYLLSLGYGVLSPNYRGSSGRGEEFTSSLYGNAGTREHADVITLTQYAIEEGYADPDRLVVAGYSHGGFITNLCALRNGSHGHEWMFKAAISGASISDIGTMALTSDIGNLYPAELHNGGTPWKMSSDDTSTRRASMLWSFEEVMERSKREGVLKIPPILILHGANDERCHVSQAWGMRRALEHYSLPFEMAIYPRQGHMFHEQYFWIDMALRVSKWVERYIGPGRDDNTTFSERNEAGVRQ